MPTVAESLVIEIVTKGVSQAMADLRVVDLYGLKVDQLNARQRQFAQAADASRDAARHLAGFLGQTVKAAGQLEQIRIGFRTALGSAEAAEDMMNKLREFDRRSPFDFLQAAQGAQTLMGMGVAANQVIPVMESLGNAVAATGRGTEEFNRAMVAVGQIMSTGRLQGDELLQLANAGVPLNDLLKELGVSYGEVGKAGISSARFLEALNKVMSQGRFANAMSEQAKSLQGRLSSLRSATFELSASLGETLIPAVTTGAQALTKIVDTFNKAPAPVKAAAVAIGVLAVGALTAFSLWSRYVEAVVIPRQIARLNELALAQTRAAKATQTHTQAIQQQAGAMGGGGPGGGGKAAGFARVLPWLAAAEAVNLGGEMAREAAPKTGPFAKAMQLHDFLMGFTPGGMAQNLASGKPFRGIQAGMELGILPGGQAKPGGDKPKGLSIQEQQVELLKSIERELQGLRTGAAFPDLPGRTQAMIARMLGDAV